MEFRKITDQGMGWYRYEWHASSLRWKQILHSHVSCFSLLALLLKCFLSFLDIFLFFSNWNVPTRRYGMHCMPCVCDCTTHIALHVLTLIVVVVTLLIGEHCLNIINLHHTVSIRPALCIFGRELISV